MSQRSVKEIIGGIHLTWPTPDEMERLKNDKTTALEKIDQDMKQLVIKYNELIENGDPEGIALFYGSIIKQLGELKERL